MLPNSPTRRARLQLSALGLALSLCSACGATCDRDPDEPPVRHTAGSTDAASGRYESTPIEGPFLDFPAGRTVQFVHGLGRRPDDFAVWLSFDRCPMPEPCEPGDDVASSVTLGVGNQALIEDVTDEHVTVRNDTCSDIRIRLTAFVYGAPGAPPDAGAP